MFKKHAIQLSIAKKPKNDETPTTLDEILNPDSAKLIEETGKRLVKYVALTVVGAIVAIKAVDILGEIAVKKTKSADNE